MSINSLTNDALRRSGEFRTAAQQAIQTPEADRAARGTMEEATENISVTNALDYLIKFIPTESITLYVATVSATPVLKLQWPFITEPQIYGLYAVLTPILLFLVYIGKRKAGANLPALPSLREVPWWKMLAAMTAFLAWALAVPGNGLLQGQVQVLGGLAAIVVSVILSVLDPIFRRNTTN